jgi:hypothetical protein
MPRHRLLIKNTPFTATRSFPRKQGKRKADAQRLRIELSPQAEKRKADAQHHPLELPPQAGEAKNRRAAPSASSFRRKQGKRKAGAPIWLRDDD